MLTFFAIIMAVAGVAHAGLAAYVAWRRNVRMGWSLAVLLLAVAWWGVAYGMELAVDDIALKSRWGDLKYLGVAMLPPAWLTSCCSTPGGTGGSPGGCCASWPSCRC